ncbi:MAG: hypothetical protein ABI743_13445 [bacterium]
MTPRIRRLLKFLRLFGLLLAGALAIVGGLKMSQLLPPHSSDCIEVCNPCDALDPAWIAFVGRTEGLAGHGLVLLGHGFADSAITWEESWGIYPEYSWGVLKTVPSYLVEEDPREPSPYPTTQQLIVRIDAAQYTQIHHTIDTWTDQHRFHIGNSDCISLLQALATQLDLQQPSRVLHPMPENWVRALVIANAPNN